MGAHRRDEFHLLVQDVGARSHGAGVRRGGPGVGGSMKAWLGFFSASRAAPRRPGSDPSSCPGRTSWKSARPQRWLCRSHGARRPSRPPFLPRSAGRWPTLQSRLVLVVGEARREVGAAGRRRHVDRAAVAPPPSGISLRNLGAHGWPATRSRALQMALAGPGGGGQLSGWFQGCHWKNGWRVGGGWRKGRPWACSV